jgi:polysaccharide biosynthesis/export protein
MIRISIVILPALIISCLSAQAPATPPADNAIERLRPNYVLGPGDQVNIRALEIDEVNGPFRIDSEGDVNLPVLGKVHASGLNIEQLEAELIQRSKALVKEPHVTVNLV